MLNANFFYVLIISLVFCIGCAEKIDSPDSVATVPESPWVLVENINIEGAMVYESCASCHLADGSGRSDGLVPRLAGQREKVLLHKLKKLRDGEVTLPVMVPFARALSEVESSQVANYIASLPSVNEGVSSNKNYEVYCSACHGGAAQGNDVLLAPKLCGQHSAYLDRRMSEIKQNIRGDADMGMMSVLNAINPNTQNEIVQWLAVGQCLGERGVMESSDE